MRWIELRNEYRFESKYSVISVPTQRKEYSKADIIWANRGTYLKFRLKTISAFTQYCMVHMLVDEENKIDHVQFHGISSFSIKDLNI